MRNYLYILISVFCGILVFSYSAAQETRPLPEFTLHGVALHPDSLSYAPDSDLVHPAIVETDGRITDAHGKYYMYYSPHGHVAISMAFSNSIMGPWKEYHNNPVIEGPAAPDIRWIDEKGRFFMWAHKKNNKTELWTSVDGLHFDYSGIAITAANINTRNATYTRVYEYPLEKYGSKYIMLYSGLTEESGIRSIWLAHSKDAENWIQIKTPLVEPVTGENNNIYGPALLQFEGRNFITYQDNTDWRGGNLKYVEVDSDLNPVAKGGVRFVLMDPIAGPPLNNRLRGSVFYTENNTVHMYSGASRNPRIIVYATAGIIKTNIHDVEPEQVNLKIYPNPVSDVVTIKLHDPQGFTRWILYNTSGSIVKNEEIHTGNLNTEYTFNISELTSGMYVLKIIRGEKIIRRKIIKN